MALMPVCSGSLTGWRTMMPGATISTGRRRRRLDRAAAVHRPAERVHHAAEHRRADRHLEQAAGAADLVALLELQVVAQDGGADVVLFEVEHQARDRLAGLLRGELEHLAGHGRLQAVDAGDAVPHLEDGADLGWCRPKPRSAAAISLRRTSLSSPGRRIESVAMVVSLEEWVDENHVQVQLVKIITISQPGSEQGTDAESGPRARAGSGSVPRANARSTPRGPSSGQVRGRGMPAIRRDGAARGGWWRQSRAAGTTAGRVVPGLAAAAPRRPRGGGR